MSVVRSPIPRLFIDRCELVVIPEYVSLLVNLQKLFVSDNEIGVVPLWLERLPLTVLALDNNKIERFPPLKLPLLKELHLDNNALKDLPSSIRSSPRHR